MCGRAYAKALAMWHRGNGAIFRDRSTRGGFQLVQPRSIVGVMSKGTVGCVAQAFIARVL
jgi:hypothetical protein